jgi:hypothetical protein
LYVVWSLIVWGDEMNYTDSDYKWAYEQLARIQEEVDRRQSRWEWWMEFFLYTFGIGLPFVLFAAMGFASL